VAYSATVTCTTHTISGRRGMIIQIVEADAAATSEWKTTHTAGTNPVTLDGTSGLDIPIFPVGTITLYQSELVDATSTGTTIAPRMGKASGWTNGTQDEISRQATPAAFFRDTTHVPYAFNPAGAGGVKPKIFGKSTVDAGTDNDIITLIHIVEGHVVGGGTGSSDGGVDFAAGVELTDGEARSFTLGIGADDFFSINTAAADKERLNAHKPLYLVDDTTQIERVGGAVLIDGTHTEITGTAETATALKTVTIKGNRFAVGDLVEACAWGLCEVSGGADTTEFLLKFGTVEFFSSGNLNLAVGEGYEFKFSGIIRSIGATGTITFTEEFCRGTRGSTPSRTLDFGGSGTTSTETIDTTADTAFGWYGRYSAATPDTDKVRCDGMYIKINGSPVAE
jgi:hypothetical protein